MTHILERLQPNEVLVIGKNEQLPAENQELTPWYAYLRLYQRR